MKMSLVGAIPQGFLYAREEVNPCPTNQSDPADIPAVVGLLSATDNIALSIKKLRTKPIKSSSGVPISTKPTVGRGNASATDTSSNTRCVSSA